MSGGVDSSVAAAMLVEQGYDVVGATMKLFCHGDDVPDRPCCSLDSVNDARRVCEQLGIPLYTDVDTLARMTADRTGLDRAAVAAALGDTPILDNDALVELGHSLDSIRQEVLDGRSR